jgi:hypothetical protein
MAIGDFLALQWQRTPVIYSDEERKIFASTFVIGAWVIGFGLAGVLIIFIWSHGVAAPVAGGSPTFSAVFGVDLLIAAAGAATGALLGFIFGIPRTLVPAGAAAAGGGGEGGPQSASQAALYTNTNLERISDWLTTLLVGATLVQIKDIVSWIGHLGGKLLQNGALTNDAAVPVIVVYFFALAFLGVYLVTRLYLTFAFRQTLALLAQAPDLGDLVQKLNGALALGTADALKGAVAAYSSWTFGPGDKDDPSLNASMARIAAKLLASGQAVGSPVASAAALKEAVSKAAADPALKSQLRADVASGQFTTGDKSLDAQIASSLAA